MFHLRDLPKYETIRQRASRYPQIDPRAVELCLMLMRVGSDVLDGFESYLARHGLSQGKFTLLMLLNREPDKGVSPSALAERGGVSRATITGLLRGLEREGLIRRLAHDDDGRRATVVLTTLGRERLDALLPDYYRRLADLMKSLDESEKATLVELLEKVQRGLPSLGK